MQRGHGGGHYSILTTRARTNKKDRNREGSCGWMSMAPRRGKRQEVAMKSSHLGPVVKISLSKERVQVEEFLFEKCSWYWQAIYCTHLEMWDEFRIKVKILNLPYLEMIF